MGIDDLKNDWRGQTEAEAVALIASIERSQRKRRILLGMFISNTLVAICVSAYAMLRSRGDMLPMLALLAILFLGLALLLKSYRFRIHAGTVADSARRSLEIVDRELKNQRVLVWFACAALPAYAFAILNLVDSGKMRTGDALGMGAVLAVVIAVNAVVQVWRRKARLMPQRRRLEELIGAL